MITKEDKILILRKKWMKTYNSEKCREIDQEIEKIERCDCGGWITSSNHHFDWCKVNIRESYLSYAKDDLDF